MSDVNAVLNIINSGVVAALGFFANLLGSSHMASHYIAMVAIAMIGRFLLKPLFGSVGSDKVKKSDIRSKESKHE